MSPIPQLHVRQRQVAAPGRLQDYYAAARAEACAEAQASCHDWLLGQEGLLTDEEREVLRWGRNASGAVCSRGTGFDIKIMDTVKILAQSW